MNAAALLFLAAGLALTNAGCNHAPDANPSMKIAPGAQAPAAPSAIAGGSRRTIDLQPREPPASRLVVMLHGMGMDPESFEEVARALQPTLPQAEVLLPEGFHPFDGGHGAVPPNGGHARQWLSVRDITDENRASRVRAAGSEVSEWIDGELSKRSLTGDRLVLVGISQGAIVAAWLATHRTPRPAAVVMLAGKVLEDESPPPTAPAVAVLIANGDHDPVEPSASVLQAWGARVTTRVYPGLRHGDVTPAVIADVTEFLRTAVRGP